MTFVLLMIFLLPLGAALAAVGRVRAEAAYFPAICALCALGYVCALAGVLAVLPVLAWLLWAAALAVLAWALRTGRARWLDLMRQALPFAVLCAVFWWFCRGCAFTSWDDFSHWGRAAKILYYTDGLYTAADAGTDFQSYPPATALLQYLFLRLPRSAFREDLCLYANAVFTASALTVPLAAIPKNRVLAKWGLWAALGLLPLTVYPQWLFQMGVDGLLGLVLAAVLLSATGQGRPWVQLIAGALGCTALVLVKSTGFALAFMAGVFLLWRLRAFRWRAAIPLTAAVAAKLSWQLHLALMGAAERWQSNQPLPDAVWALLTGKGQAYQYQVWQSFWHSVLRECNYPGLLKFPFIGWCVLFCVLWLLALVFAAPARRRAVLALGGSALAAGWVFVLGLLVSYLFFFTQSEAETLASISRYLLTCVSLWTAVGLAMLGASLAALTARAARAAVALALVWLAAADCSGLGPAFMQAPLNAAHTQNQRATVRHGAQRILSLGLQQPRLYLITANDAGASQLQIEYELYPVRLPLQSSILMTSGGWKEPWVKHCTWQQWSRELAEGYDYVYLYSVEDQFVAEFLPVFEDEAAAVGDSLFQVIAQKDGTARLRRIG